MVCWQFASARACGLVRGGGVPTGPKSHPLVINAKKPITSSNLSRIIIPRLGLKCGIFYHEDGSIVKKIFTRISGKNLKKRLINYTFRLTPNRGKSFADLFSSPHPDDTDRRR